MSEGKLVWISGLSGAGKTTLAEGLKKECGFDHFDVDVWSFGGSPLKDSGIVPTPEMLAARDKDLIPIYDKLMKDGFGKVKSGEEVDLTAFTDFYDLLFPVLTQTIKDVKKDLVISHTVVLKSVRDYIRKSLPNIEFIILNPDIEDVATRKASERGLSLSDFFKTFHPNYDGPEFEEKQIIEMLKEQSRASAVGFEVAGENEHGINVTLEMDANQVLTVAKQILNIH